MWFPMNVKEDRQSEHTGEHQSSLPFPQRKGERVIRAFKGQKFLSLCSSEVGTAPDRAAVLSTGINIANSPTQCRGIFLLCLSSRLSLLN